MDVIENRPELCQKLHFSESHCGSSRSSNSSTGCSKKHRKVYGTIILQPYVTESSWLQQIVQKEIL